ncbi:MAG TPA: hypothetical protein VFW24_17415 [Acidimicrobiales bacterium]|nr:hypothetical protein [Acidimicrobiales bacterium]
MADGPEFGGDRQIMLDDRGTGLRITWHPQPGVAVLSLWRGDRCIGTFRAPPADMAALISFLSSVLAGAAAPGRLPTELRGSA